MKWLAAFAVVACVLAASTAEAGNCSAFFGAQQQFNGGYGVQQLVFSGGQQVAFVQARPVRVQRVVQQQRFVQPVRVQAVRVGRVQRTIVRGPFGLVRRIATIRQ